MSHHCHEPGCRNRIPRRRVMCRRHWFALPWAVRRAIIDSYRPDQPAPEGEESPAWVEAARKAYVAPLRFMGREIVRRMEAISKALAARAGEAAGD